MSWIRDVKDDLQDVDDRSEHVRRSGILLGVVFLIFGIIFLFKAWILTACFVILISFFWLGGALFFPHVLRKPYRIWMVFGLAIGWWVSRVILAILFYAVLTPVALICRIFGKSFLDLCFRDGKESYWLDSESKAQKNYQKLY